MTTTLETLQATLAAEHAAVWTFGTLGAQASRSRQPVLAAALAASYAAHRSHRDQLVRDVRDLGVEPVATAPGYALPDALSTAAQVRRAALATETRCAAAYADLVAGTYGEQRARAVTELVQTAVRELDYRGTPENFPGLTELADRRPSGARLRRNRPPRPATSGCPGPG